MTSDKNGLQDTRENLLNNTTMMDDESNPPFEVGLATNESGIFEGKLSTRNRANSAEK